MRDDDTNPVKYIGLIIIGVAALMVLMLGYWVYTLFRIDVPSGNMAVITKKTGEDLENHESISPNNTYKGVQKDVLTEGRHFYNPWKYDWAVYPMVEVPAGKMGVRVRLHGKNLPYGHFMAMKEEEKGIIQEVLRPGRYAINAVIKGEESIRPKNDYAEIVELHDPVTIPAGFRGVVTDRSGPIPADPNNLLSDKGFRGVQKDALDAGTYYMNPYQFRVNIIDCRSQRFNLGEGQEMGFPSKDGFWVNLDGIVEFRIKPDMAAEIFVLYNDSNNDSGDEANISDEIVRKIVMPNARSFCRLRGSNAKGRDFIGGDTRTAIQKEFQEAMVMACDGQGIEIVQALITKIQPPEAIAKPVRDREVAKQKLFQFKEQKIQQDSEAKLAVEKGLILQRQAMVKADQEVIQKITLALQLQKVAITKANEELTVSKQDLAASKDQAEAIMSRKKAEAGLIDFNNIAEAAGWKKSIDAFNGDGVAFGRYVMYQKLAPSFKSIMSNTADSPLMDIFRNFTAPVPVRTEVRADSKKKD